MRTKGGRSRGQRKSARCGKMGLSSPPAHLESRQKAFEAFEGGSKGRGAGGLTYRLGAFHRPGSTKK